MSKVSINVSSAASRKGLKTDLSTEARRRGYTLSRVVADVLMYALKNKRHFEKPIERPRDHGGNHISTTVSPHVRDELNNWAESRNSRRSNLVAFILEKALELEVFDAIYSSDDQDEDED